MQTDRTASAAGAGGAATVQRSGPTAALEDEGWSDPTVRAKLVLQPGQVMTKWLTAPPVILLRKDVSVVGREGGTGTPPKTTGYGHIRVRVQLIGHL